MVTVVNYDSSGAATVTEEVAVPDQSGIGADELLTFGDFSEIALAEALVQKYPDVRYVDRWKSFLIWDGKLWAKDETMRMMSRAREICKEAAWQSNDSGKQLKRKQTVAAIWDLARSDTHYGTTTEQWDRDPWLLNTSGGIVSLKTGQLHDHSPEHHMTKITAVAPGHSCPRWFAFLNQVLDGDKEIIGYLQRYFGYCLTGLVSEHCLQFLYGTGRNGKGVYINTLRGVMGSYAMTTGMETFTESFGDRHPTDIASLMGARFVSAEEVQEGKRWAESKIKMLTGGSPVSARFMRQNFFEFMPQFKLCIAGNHKPSLRDVDRAIRDRIQLVPFRVYIEPEKRDKDLEDKLREEWPGILQWGIDGCLEWRRIGLAVPEAVKEETANYFNAQDTFGNWLEECCEVTNPTAWETPTRLFNSWKAYAKDSNVNSGRSAEFNDRLDAKGFRHGRDNLRGRHWEGIKLKPEPINEPYGR
jgi:P4 family phage/plasmid primase-like protien